MRLFFLSLISIIITIAGCGRTGLTGYKYGGGESVDDHIIETCKEESFMDKWWDFTTNNSVANTLVPMYKDYCTYTSEDYVFYWNTEELYGYFYHGWNWYCSDKNTMQIVNETTGGEISMRIYGKVSDDCYDVKLTYGAVIMNGDLCECLYNGP